LSEQQFAFQPQQFRVPKQFFPSCSKLLRLLNYAQAFVNAVVP
jgi:hypothetical protein